MTQTLVGTLDGPEDDELAAMGEISRLLDGLNPAAQKRVLSWLRDRYRNGRRPAREKPRSL